MSDRVRRGADRAGPTRPLLIVGAWAPELTPLRRALARHRWTAARPAPILATVGVGMVEAAAATAALIARFPPGGVLFVGTAGSYSGARRRLRAPRAVVVRRLTLPSSAALRGWAYLPGPMPREARTDKTLRRALARAGQIEVADVACPLAITRTAGLGRRLAAAGRAELENLEAFAVARAAAQAAVPFAAVLGISNRVGPGAHGEWMDNHVAASRAACTVVAAFLAAAPPPQGAQVTSTAPVNRPAARPRR